MFMIFFCQKKDCSNYWHFKLSLDSLFQHPTEINTKMQQSTWYESITPRYMFSSISLASCITSHLGLIKFAVCLRQILAVWWLRVSISGSLGFQTKYKPMPHVLHIRASSIPNRMFDHKIIPGDNCSEIEFIFRWYLLKPNDEKRNSYECCLLWPSFKAKYLTT